MTAELPGFEPSDVQVLLTDRVITIRGEKTLEDLVLEPLRGEERFFGRFERRIALLGPIRADSVIATFKEGTLSVVMVKAIDPSRPKRIAVDE